MLRKIASNTISQIISKFLTALIAIVLMSLLTNYLSIELFGTYNKAYNYIYILTFLADLGLYAITIKEISNNKDKAAYIFGNILTLRILSGIFIFVFAILLALILPEYNQPLILGAITILGVFSFFSLINSSMLSLMQSYMKIEFSLISIVSGKILILAFTYLIIYHWHPHPEVTGYFTPFLLIITAGAIGIAFNAFLNYFYARKIIPIIPQFDFTYIKHIFLTSLPYGLALFLSVIYTKIDIFLLSVVEVGALAERSIALYSLPLKIMDVFMILGAFLMNALLPSMSKSFADKKYKDLKKTTETAFRVMLIFGVGVIASGLIYKDYIIRLIANENYLEVTALNAFTASNAFDIVLYMLLFFYLGLVFSYSLIATGKQNRLLKINIILTIVNIIGNILLIPYISFMGAGIMTIITQLLFLILTYYYSRDVLDFHWNWKYISIILLAGLAVYYGNILLLQQLSFGNIVDLTYGIVLFGIYAGVLTLYEFKKAGKNIFQRKN